MMRYMKLVNFEMNRFSKIYLSLLLITVIAQLAGVFLIVKGFIKRMNETIRDGNITEEAFLQQYGGFDFTHVSNSLWFIGPIALCAVALIFYMFLIWYRDWFGKNTFIYRLLMLPTSRLSIYLSKATAIFLMVLGLISFQLVILPMENALFNRIAPETLLIKEMSVPSIIQLNGILNLIIPISFTQFLISYGIGLMIMVVLFTAIMFERSYRFKGIALGIVYGVAAGVLFLSPVLADAFDIIDFYPSEILGLLIALGFSITGLSIWIGSWLLKNRVTV